MARKTLPRLPSAGIRLALEDLEKAEQNPDLTVNMNTWMSRYGRNEPCAVCLAGSVMAGTLGVVPEDINGAGIATQTPNGLFYSGRISTSTRDKLRALDSFRVGAVQRGVAQWLGLQDQCGDYPTNHPKLGGLSNVAPVVYYPDDPKKFKSQLRRIATMLEKRGL